MHLAATGGQVSGASRAGGLAVAAVMVMAGAALAFDCRGVATRFRTDTQAWWGAGRIRRRFRVRVPVRKVGALTAIVGLLLIAAIIYQ